MSAINISNLASEILCIFERTLNFFQSIGILQAYSFNHSDVFFSPSADKYLENFISLLEEIKNVLDKLQVLPKQTTPVEIASSSNTANMIPGDLISASHFISSSEMFTTEQLITPHDELGSFITPTVLLNNDYIVPQIVNEPHAEPSWIPTEDKDEQDDQEKETADEPASVEKEKFECSVCNKVLSSNSSLKFHQATHTGQKYFCCEHCGKLFTTNTNLSAHLTRQHNLNTESANSCNKCGKLFVRKSALDTHMKCHMGVKPWACCVCEKTFTQKVTRDIHQLTHTRDYKFSCDECGKMFPTKAKLNYHRKSHGEPQFMCNLCDKKFATRQNLNAHYRTHDIQAHCRLDTVPTQMVESRTFTCTQCDRSFSSQHTLALHSQKHNPMSARYRYLERQKMAPKQKHLCTVCGKEFSLKKSLFHHQRQKHSNNLSETQQRPYSCQICQKRFTLKKKMTRHMLIHTQPLLEHRCSICGRLFRRKDSLQRHENWHSGTTSLVCAKCGHVSVSAAERKEHAKAHAANFRCQQCEKSFRSKTSLRFHEQSHDGKFKFQCSYCGKQFVRKCHYHGHLLSHSTDRPYKCDSCGKSFKDNKSCREHCKRVHPPQHVQAVLPNVSAEMPTNQMAGAELTANEMAAASQMTIHSLLAGDDATYGQTYDQFQACVQLQ